MGEPAIKYPFTVEEYLEREKTSLVKHEYHEGEIFAMAGGTPRHSILVNNVGGELRNALKGKSCVAHSSETQLATSRRRFVYADGSVICGKLTSFEENPLAANNPVVIVEVLSDSTSAYDRGGKFMRYRQMPSFREYVLIEQRFPQVDVFFRTESGLWKISSYEDLSADVEIQSINVKIPMAELYANVEFDAPSDEDWYGKQPFLRPES